MEADGQQGNRDAGAAGTDKANQGAEDEHGGKQHEDHPFKQKIIKRQTDKTVTRLTAGHCIIFYI